MASRYEYSFTANSPILSAAFHPYNPFLIYGGLYNGKIVMWDIREKSTPVQSSDIRRNGHNAPIYSYVSPGRRDALVSTSSAALPPAPSSPALPTATPATGTPSSSWSPTLSPASSTRPYAPSALLMD